MPIDDSKPKTVGTPEGDNEYPPDTPLAPVPDGLETPIGNAPDSYKADKPADQEATQDKEKPKGIEKFIDEVVRGEYM